MAVVSVEDPVPDTGRHAIYWAPPAGSALARLGSAWLGRDAETGEAVPRSVPLDIDPAQADALTESPRFYGFHGTLKAPFSLAPGYSARDLTSAMATFAARRPPVTLPRLAVTALGPFIALVPSAPVPALEDLATACVADLDTFRAPLDPADLARRQAAGLSARQSDLLARWGYPYVMEEFHFHLTLTGPIADATDRAAVLDALRDICAPVCATPPPLDSLALFHQPDRDTPFRLVARVPLGTALAA